MKSRRAHRVADLIAQEVAMIMRTKTADKRFMLCTITGAKVSNDLKIAHIFVSVLGTEDEVTETLDSLDSAKGFFRRELGHRLNLKYTPDLRFIYDESLVRGQRIISELDSLVPEDDHSSEDDE